MKFERHQMHRFLSSLQSIQQHPHRYPAHLPRWLRNSSKRRPHKLSNINSVKADDRNITRNMQPKGCDGTNDRNSQQVS